MSKKTSLQLICQECQNPVTFSIYNHDKPTILCCSQCQKKYLFSENLSLQLYQFENLCEQIQLSEEILSNAGVILPVDHRKIKIPYKSLLTQLHSTLDLTVDGKPLTISFLIEPIENKI
jgi:hypothetical protein